MDKNNDLLIDLGSMGKFSLIGLIGYSTKKEYVKQPYSYKLSTVLYYKGGPTIIIDAELCYDNKLKLDKALTHEMNNVTCQSEIDYLRQKVDLLADEVSNVKYQLDAFVQMAANSTDLKK